MKRLAQLLWSAWLYACMATVLAIGVGAAYASMRGWLTEAKLLRMIAAARGIDVSPQNSRRQATEPSQQPSLDEIARARALRARDLELRELALETGVADLKYEQAKLADEKDRYEVIKTAFEAKLRELRDGALAANLEQVRLILENIPPKQAKDQLLKMLADGEIDQAAALLSAMPIAKRAKILKEFKSEPDSEDLAKLLKRLREGGPEVPIIDDSFGQLKQPQSIPP